MSDPTVTPLNNSLESGVRAAIILNSLFPRSVDLQRLVDFDYLVVHSADVGGPDSLHTPTPLRAGELLVRRSVIQGGLMLMMSKGLIARVPTEDGIEFSASESTNSFVGSLGARYLLKLKERSAWVSESYGDSSKEGLAIIMRGFFDKWTSQFETTKEISRDSNE
jgi:hypothetical protein